MATTTITRPSPRAWMTIAFAMFAVGWGANQFAPMLIVYRHELRLTAGEVAGLFLVIQTLEGNVIAPLIQKRTVDLPPALTILSQTVLGTLLGPMLGAGVVNAAKSYFTQSFPEYWLFFLGLLFILVTLLLPKGIVGTFNSWWEPWKAQRSAAPALAVSAAREDGISEPDMAE